MHKTFTDCHLAPGGSLTGGGWGYALNSNNSNGEEARVANGTGKLLDEDKRMLAYCVLGWETVEVRICPELRQRGKAVIFSVQQSASCELQLL